MSRLTEEQYNEIAKTVTICPVSEFDFNGIETASFSCGAAAEYTAFLFKDAVELDKRCVSKTFLIIHNKTNELVGYFSLAADTVKLTLEEKQFADLSEVAFKSLPAVKLGKLAINKNLSSNAKRRGYGSFVLDIVDTYAFAMVEAGVACRFVTVDADIEYDPDTVKFYEKNGFVLNLSRKIRPSDKTVSMRRDIFRQADGENIW